VAEYLKKVLDQIQKFFSALTPGKKAMVVGISVAIVVSITTLFIWAGKSTYRPLMTNLNPEDATNIMRILREKKISYEMDASGRNISIPPESVYDLRLELATMGLPQSGNIGYELFDKQTLGASSFVQKLNRNRALEGELIRSINTIKGVRRSRVHLVMPEKSTFVEDQKKSTASVILDLDPGTVLNEKQIYGIGTLVARGVEGLEVSDVAIMDSSGKILSKNTRDSLVSMTADQIDFKSKYEEDRERGVIDMLSRVVGEGHVVAKVTADFDFTRVNETQTIFDQDGIATRSVQRNNASMEGSRPSPSGPAGATANTPGQPVGGENPGVKSDTKKTNEVVNYEVPQTLRQTMKPSGTLKRLSVAIAIDAKTTKTTDKDGKITAKVDPWSPEKIKEFESLVSGALGLDKKRGDSIDIKSMEFVHEDFEEAQRMLDAQERRSYVRHLTLYLVVGIIIILFFMFVVRPFIQWLTENTIEGVDSFLPQTVEELEKFQKNGAMAGLEEAMPVLPDRIDPAKVEGEMIKEKIITLVDTNPHKAALVLKDWIKEDRKKDKDKDKDGKTKTA